MSKHFMSNKTEPCIAVMFKYNVIPNACITSINQDNKSTVNYFLLHDHIKWKKKKKTWTFGLVKWMLMVKSRNFLSVNCYFVLLTSVKHNCHYNILKWLVLYLVRIVDISCSCTAAHLAVRWANQGGFRTWGLAFLKGEVYLRLDLATSLWSNKEQDKCVQCNWWSI